MARLISAKSPSAKDIPPVMASVSALLMGLGTFLWWQFNFDSTPDGLFFRGFIMGSIFLAALYFVWILIAYVLLVQVYKASADLQALIRTMGYAALPLALGVLAFIPVLYPVFAIVPLALVFVMSIYAVQAVTNADSTQVVMANLIGFTVMVLVLGIIATSSDFPDAPIGAGIFAWIPKI